MSPCRKFVRLLSIELESLEEELQLMVEALDKRLEIHEITEYVRNENYTVLRNEMLGLRDFIDFENCLESETPETPEEIRLLAKKKLRERILDRGYMPALLPLVELRIDRIAAYLELETASA